MGGGWSQGDHEPKVPHCFEAIIKRSDSPVDRSSTERLYDQLYAGVFLDGKRKKYWVDKQGNNCFMLFGKDLSITWAEDSRYWRWRDMETSDGLVEVAELVKVCWLEVHGKFDATYLSPDIRYEIAFVIMLNDDSSGWKVPVNIGLEANGSQHEHKENLNEHPRNRWIEILAGEVKENNRGGLEFSLFETEGGLWKRGLVIKGVIIRPKKHGN